MDSEIPKKIQSIVSELETSLTIELHQLEAPPVELTPLRELRKRKAPIVSASEARPTKRARKQ
jgi:hypothetical protein